MSAPVRSWSWPAPSSVPLGVEGTALADRWVRLLGIAVFGYALAGRGFAYLGVPPIFIGEVVMALGLGVALWEGSLTRAFSSGTLKVLAGLMAWVAFRTVGYLGTYGIDALRDAMLVGYGLYAVAIVAVLTARPERLLSLVLGYRAFVVVIPVVGWAIYLLVRQMPDLLPTWPWSLNTHIIEVKPGDLQVHLAAVTAFLVLGFRKAKPMLLVMLIFSLAIGMIGNRGGMVGFALAMTALTIMKPKTARFGKMGVTALVLVALALLVDTTGIETSEGSRTISVEQIWENVASIFGHSRSNALNTTTEWRMQWWTGIIDYTINGPYFWEGKGFGINLATADGFRVDEEESLRSPHNVHLTLLARGGVPAFVLWLSLVGAWYLAVMRAWWAARQARQARWMGLLAVCVAYCTAALVNASFDVHLEGPMGGIPFWTFFGVGLAAARIYPHRPDLLDALPEGPPEIPPPPQPAYGWSGTAPAWHAAPAAAPAVPAASPAAP